MNNMRKTNVLIVFIVLFATSASAGKATFLEGLPPAEKYRQLSLIVLISAGADAVLLESLGPQDDTGNRSAGLSPDDYKTPLIRIVDQQSMLSGAAFLLRFAQKTHLEIQAELEQIRASNPVLISMVNRHETTEDAIIIRNAIADAIEYSTLMDDESILPHLKTYRMQTIRIRNVMEFERFDRELTRLTNEAILSVGGKSDAYQRMFDEEVDTKEFDREFDAAQYIYNRTAKFDEKAGKLTEDIMKSVILSQSKPTPMP